MAESELLKGMVFPPQPSIIMEIMHQKAMPEPDLRIVAQLVSQDLTLAASLLKTVNSPIYGLRRKVTSILEAVNLIGINRTFNLVIGLSLCNVPPQPGLETFWEDTNRSAQLSSSLAKDMGVDADLAYLMGLFHDSGIPLMVQKYSDYLVLLNKILESSVFSLFDVENEKYHTDHAMVGSLFARYWCLPEIVIQAIRLHHDGEVFTYEIDSEIKNLIAVNLITEYLIDDIAGRTNVNWLKMGQSALDYLMIDEQICRSFFQNAYAKWQEEAH